MFCSLNHIKSQPSSLQNKPQCTVVTVVTRRGRGGAGAGVGAAAREYPQCTDLNLKATHLIGRRQHVTAGTPSNDRSDHHCVRSVIGQGSCASRKPRTRNASSRVLAADAAIPIDLPLGCRDAILPLRCIGAQAKERSAQARRRTAADQ